MICNGSTYYKSSFGTIQIVYNFKTKSYNNKVLQGVKEFTSYDRTFKKIYKYRYFKKMIKLFKTGMSEDCDEFPQMLEGKIL